MSGYVGNVCENARLGMNDGPQGFRDNDHLGSTTAWPCSLAIGATFDEQAALEWGASMGEEFYGKGANVQLGPGIPACAWRACRGTGATSNTSRGRSRTWAT